MSYVCVALTVHNIQQQFYSPNFLQSTLVKVNCFRSASWINLNWVIWRHELNLTCCSQANNVFVELDNKKYVSLNIHHRTHFSFGLLFWCSCSFGVLFLKTSRDIKQCSTLRAKQQIKKDKCFIYALLWTCFIKTSSQAVFITY